jgi:hypothetical protein
LEDLAVDESIEEDNQEIIWEDADCILLAGNRDIRGNLGRPRRR